MRPFEWFLVLSFVPAALLPVIPDRLRRRWLLAAALLPALASGSHLLLEGWRTQMLPLYVLVPLVLVSRLLALLGRGEMLRRRRGVLVSVLLMLIVALGAVLAGWLLPVVTLPEPTGPYPVGIADRELRDDARGRRLMVSVWYPAAGSGPAAPLTRYPEQAATALADFFGLPAPLLQHLRYFMVAAHADAPIAADGAPFPVLVFSHGLGGLRLQNSSTLQELASWGYVIVAIDHTDAAAVTVFPDGESRFFNLELFGITPEAYADPAQHDTLLNSNLFPVWVADQRFVYDVLDTWAISDPLLAGKLDLARTGSFGHSFGGATALEVCRVDARCRAAVNMDGGLYGDIVSQPAVRPLLLMTSSGTASRYPEVYQTWQQMVAAARDSAYWLELPNSTHYSYTVSQLLSPVLVPRNFDPRAGLAVVDRLLRAFFDRHLRGLAAPALDDADSTDVTWIVKPAP